jgi:spore coat protein A
MHGGPAANPDTTGQVMKFRIVAPSGPDDSSLPQVLPAIERLDPADSVITRRMTLSEGVDEYGRPKLLLNNMSWADAITEVIKLGDVEVWEFVNYTPDAHPMHLHLGHAQLLERFHRPTKTELPIAEYDQGWEDTFVVNPQENLKVLVRFDQFAGRFVWHCHVLEHEDHEMMRPFDVVVPEPAGSVLAVMAATSGLAIARRRRR